MNKIMFCMRTVRFKTKH
uniref:Uncharacterized protein n=1 Tax=Anguilla anguilla TaxID=7936 RepID=A0A0E9RC33_ANGAN